MAEYMANGDGAPRSEEGDQSHAVGGTDGTEPQGTSGEPVGQGARLFNEGGVDDGPEDSEYEAIRARIRQIEEEADALETLQYKVDDELSKITPVASRGLTHQENEENEVCARSVYVGNVNYNATAGDLDQYFCTCGSINRITIVRDKDTGFPKGFAYIEFAENDSVGAAITLNETFFQGRLIRVMAKKPNVPGAWRYRRPGRGGGYGGLPRRALKPRWGLWSRPY